jgi:4-diphosphocytidyl-2-C-methyl-D-erythritol kinase
MIIDQTSRATEILAPAKVNLFLEVLGKRPDGYHEIDTVMCPIRLFDRVIFEATNASALELDLCLPSQLEPSDDPAWNVPADHDNLVMRALKRLQSKLGTTQGGRLRLEKNIPAAAGLAGGSSDTAASVCAALLAWGRWDRQLATAVCTELGSDIPFFLGDPQRIGLARATGRGENCQLLSMAPPLRFLVTHPPVGCPTGEVYRRFVLPPSTRNSSEIIGACKDGQFNKIGAELFNALQLAASGLTPWVERQLQCFAAAGLNYGIMSGSGSSCFALVDGDQEGMSAVARSKAAARAMGIARCYEVDAHFAPSIESQL